MTLQLKREERTLNIQFCFKIEILIEKIIITIQLFTVLIRQYYFKLKKRNTWESSEALFNLVVRPA